MVRQPDLWHAFYRVGLSDAVAVLVLECAWSPRCKLAKSGSSASRKYGGSNLAHTKHVDVFVIAEYAFADATLLSSLNSADAGNYYVVAGQNPRIRLFSRLQEARWKDRFGSQPNNRMTAHTLRVGGSRSILLVGFHGHDRRSVPIEADRASLAQTLSADIRLVEKDVGHSRTVACGDFNMNPFEQGMVAAQGMHALLSRRLTETIHKLGRRAAYPCFYNPMWSCFGDRPVGPPGSYFFSDSLSATNQFWQMLDQVLLRASLMEALTDLEILDHDGHSSLVAKMGRPKKSLYSDHLPLLFELTL